MDVEFEFKEKNGGACVTKLLAPGAVCVVPESLGGLPVTELVQGRLSCRLMPHKQVRFFS